MKNFQELSKEFNDLFQQSVFPETPETLYGATSYILADGGKRIRPVLCLMGNELFQPIHPDSWKLAVAIELFHNFTLIHDDIMDKAPLRRGRQTVHTRYDEPTALLSGDVMLLKVYDLIIDVNTPHLKNLIRLLNKTGAEICEGQQLDMDFEKKELITPDQYIDMIERKTAVFLAAALQMGAIMGNAPREDQENIYAFGRNLGLAFQVQDDWLDSFGDPEKFGKQIGGDIMANKKTFLLVNALEISAPSEKEQIKELLRDSGNNKLVDMLTLFLKLKVDQAALDAKKEYMETAWFHLDQIRVPHENKKPLRELANYLLERDI